MAESRTAAPDFLAGGGMAGATARGVDWAATPLGSVEGWAASLKTTVGTLFHSRHPMFLWWGPELIQFYNDGYLPSFGQGKHPAAMGQRGADCWQEIWPIIWPQIDDVMTRGLASWNEDQLVPIFRNDRIEEVYWTYGYSPVFEENGRVGGTLVVCTETTARVLAERRLRTLRWLSDATAQATDRAGVLQAAAQELAISPRDAPFALFYEPDATTGAPVLVAHSVSQGMALEELDTAVRLAAAKHPEGGLARLHPETELLLHGLWPELVRGVFLTWPDPARRGAFLAFGLSPRLPFDGPYRTYFDQIAEHLERAQARIQSFRMQALAESERRNLLLQAPVATALMTGPEHLFEVANPLYCQMVGRKDIVGKTYLEAFPELAETALPGIFDQVYATGEPFVANEYPVALDRGSGKLEDCFFKFNLEPLRDTGGKVYGMMAVAVDVTAQVTARQALEKNQREREQLLTELESASRAKDEFLAMLGHELRNPLAALSMAHSLLERAEGDAVKTDKYRHLAQRQVRNLARLVEDLLDVSRITRGQVELRLADVDLASIVHNALAATRPAIESRGHELKATLGVGPFRLRADSTRLEQVLVNLLTNASKYTDPGGTLSLQLDREELDGAAQAVLSVRDTGRGIPENMLDKVFDLFVQVSPTLDRSGGLGLGLTLVKRLVEIHGGTVSAHSDGLGKGSEFVVRLPLSAEPQTQAGRVHSATMDLVATAEEAAQARQHVLLECGRRGPGSAGAVFREPSDAIRVATARLVEEGLVRALEYEVGGERKLGVRLTDLGLQRLKP